MLLGYAGITVNSVVAHPLQTVTKDWNEIFGLWLPFLSQIYAPSQWFNTPRICQEIAGADISNSLIPTPEQAALESLCAALWLAEDLISTYIKHSKPSLICNLEISSKWLLCYNVSHVTRKAIVQLLSPPLYPVVTCYWVELFSSFTTAFTISYITTSVSKVSLPS